ncbi:hypothetical protein CBR_g44394 [Chara braunii]|uniref:AB hydrolase-1 domain-containing protein n=1 Tax=Chara braunii TaxID=69332 RepID=A0A388LXF9_CHABU|nr:hypothetical protein CBR_g44394 [Chara braunii]|eukprot:GBG86941.1 hypothetical protein CBR_g44394 [Chara braunii]
MQAMNSSMAATWLPCIDDRRLGGLGPSSPLPERVIPSYVSSSSESQPHGPPPLRMAIPLRLPFPLTSMQGRSSESHHVRMTTSNRPSLPPISFLRNGAPVDSGTFLRSRRVGSDDDDASFVPSSVVMCGLICATPTTIASRSWAPIPAAATKHAISLASPPRHYCCCCRSSSAARGRITSAAPLHGVGSQGPLGSGLGFSGRARPARQPLRLVCSAAEESTTSDAAPSPQGVPEEAAAVASVAATEGEEGRAAAGGRNYAISATMVSTLSVPVETHYWGWKGYWIRYQSAGSQGPAVVLIHGFGGNCDHFRKNLPELAKRHRVFAIDLLGYGYSDKPDPKGLPPNTIYTFEEWGGQVADFCHEVVGSPAFLVCNSVGCITGLQVAVSAPDVVRGLVLLNVSLRLLHIKKQKWFAKPFIKAFQTLLRTTPLGPWFFAQVAKPGAVKNILRQAYHDDETVTDELVDKILSPGLQPGAVDVFLDFVSYSGGPLPEDLLPRVSCPVLIVWGDKDPWEPIDLGRTLGAMDSVEEFIALENVGHCPQDEAPHLVNPIVERFVAKHAN